MSDDFDNNFDGLDNVESEGDTYTEVIYESWFSRIKSAFGSILFGLLLLIGGVVLLFWNEGRAVTTANSLKEGAKLAVEAKADAIDPALDGKLVHIAGPLAIEGDPRDGDFGVTAPGVRLVRVVEMYQWKEHKSSQTEKKLGGGEETRTTYSYTKEWSDKPISSDGFKQASHRNPSMPLHGATFYARAAHLGAYHLTPEQAGALGHEEDIPLDAALAAKVSNSLRRPARLLDNRVVVGGDPGQPQIGDLRISYQSAKVEEASFIAQQRGKGLSPYATKAGDELFLSHVGVTPAKEMFKEAEEDNAILTWMLRFFGFILLFVALKLITSIASVLADVVPFFGNLVDAGLGFVAALLAGALTLLVTGVAWIYYRPLLGGSLLAGALALTLWPLLKARAQGARKAAGGAA